MSKPDHYIIEGGEAGAQRLHILARSIMPGTLELLHRAGLRRGMNVLDLGCGPGDVTVAIAQRVGPGGAVVGIDPDELLDEVERYDLVYSRFFLSHMSDPAAMLTKMLRTTVSGGVVVLEDIDIANHTYWPPSLAFERYMEIYQATARLRGADPNIGPRLPALAADAGLEVVDIHLSTPVFMAGEGKTVARLTLASIAAAAIESGITQKSEVSELLAALEEHESHPGSLQSIAQICQVIARAP